VGYQRDGRGWLLTDGLRPAKEGRHFVPSPVIDYYLKLAYYLGCPRESYRMEVFTSEEDERQAAELWARFGLDAGGPVVALNSGGAYGSAKAWPAENFAILARRLAVERSAGGLVLCGPKVASAPMVAKVESLRKGGIDIEVRVDRRGTFHDRFILTGRGAWSVGHSLRDFGRKATYLSRLPEPQPLEDYFGERWDSASKLRGSAIE